MEFLESIYQYVGEEKIFYLFITFFVIPFIFKTIRKIITTIIAVIVIYILYINYGEELISMLPF